MTDKAPRWLDYLPLDDLVPDPRNPKDHTIEDLRASLGRFGYTEPIMVDERTGMIASGHGRREMLLADREAGAAVAEGVVLDDQGRWTVPVVRGWHSANDDEALGYLIAANQLTTKGGWNDADLAAALERMVETPLSLEGIGFDEDQLARLRVSVDQHERDVPSPVDVDEVPPVPVDPVTVRGDVWQLGEHRLMCGDCRDAADVVKLLDGTKVNLAFTSPPYADRRKYDETSGFEPIHPDAYVEWFEPVAARVADHLVEDGSWFVNIKAGVSGDDPIDAEMYVLDLVIAHARTWGWHYATEFCWERNGVPKQVLLRFKNQFEVVYQFVRGRWKFRPTNVMHETDNAILPPKHPDAHRESDQGNWAANQGRRNFDEFAGQRVRRVGRGATNWDGIQGSGAGAIPGARRGMQRGPIENFQGGGEGPYGSVEVGEGWAFPGNRLPTFAGSHEALGHSAAFPVGLPAFFVKAYTDPADVVYDPFVGSGSTILAAHQEDRRGFGMEISPGYCDVVCARWQRLTGEKPVRESTGEPHDFGDPAPV